MGQRTDTGEQKQSRENTKTFLKLILEEEYCNYTNALRISQLETLDARRKKLMLSFAQTSLADGMLRDLFPTKSNTHRMKKRNKGKYKIFHAHTKCFKKTPILTMQRMLNRAETH